MGEALKIRDLDQFAFSFAGAEISTGYGEGAAIKIEKVTPTTKVKEGADGSASRSKTGSRLYKVTATYLSTSDANALLSAIALLDDISPNGAGVAPMLIQDLQGTTQLVSPSAWIETMPPLDINQEATNVEWVFYAADCPPPNWGGN